MRRIIASLLSLSFFTINADARIIGIDPNTGNGRTDIVCFGGRVAGNVVIANTEWCIDSSGNQLPTSSANTAYSGFVNGSAVPYGTNGEGIGTSTIIGTGPILSLSGRMFTNVRLGTAGPQTIGTTCGQNSSGSPFTITGSDFAGVISVGTGLYTACTLQFGDPYINTPICEITIQTSNAYVGPIVSGLPTITNTAINFGTKLQYPQKINYICVGQSQ